LRGEYGNRDWHLHGIGPVMSVLVSLLLVSGIRDEEFEELRGVMVKMWEANKGGGTRH